MTYFVYVDTCLAIDAETKEDAKKEATQILIKRLEKDEIEWLIEEEN